MIMSYNSQKASQIMEALRMTEESYETDPNNPNKKVLVRKPIITGTNRDELLSELVDVFKETPE